MKVTIKEVVKKVIKEEVPTVELSADELVEEIGAATAEILSEHMDQDAPFTVVVADFIVASEITAKLVRNLFDRKDEETDNTDETEESEDK